MTSFPVAATAAPTAAQHVDFWFDPSCPWTWLTSRWLLEVQRQRHCTIGWHLLSLAVLNEDKEVTPDYARMLEKTWGPIRVMAAVSRLRPEAVGALYTAIGTRLHPQGRTDLEQVVHESLAEAGLAPELVADMNLTNYDSDLRASTKQAMDLVGMDVGSPVISVDEVAFFGPVVNPVPREQAALQLWDATVAIAGVQGFYELKRSRDGEPQYD